MDLGELIPIVAILSTAWVMVTAMRLGKLGKKRGAEVGADTPEASRENAQLAHENERLKLTIGRLEERMAVLERIATDPAERTAREIEQLR